ncbi:hypothetical protein TKK_0004613 [Trichogramma kaykai]
MKTIQLIVVANLIIIPSDVTIMAFDSFTYRIVENHHQLFMCIFEARVEFIIHSTVAIEPQVVALPWEPTVKTRNEVALKASGGDGSYSWTS